MTKSEAIIFIDLFINHDLLLDTAEAMRIHGSSFVQALSACVVRADSINLLRLVEAFPDYFIEYAPQKWTNDKEYKKDLRNNHKNDIEDDEIKQTRYDDGTGVVTDFIPKR